jgi:hypothetical protein
LQGKAVHDFNNCPHHVLQGLSPMEVLNGKRYDDATTKEQMQLAKQNRTKENQKLKCCGVQQGLVETNH